MTLRRGGDLDWRLVGSERMAGTAAYLRHLHRIGAQRGVRIQLPWCGTMVRGVKIENSRPSSDYCMREPLHACWKQIHELLLGSLVLSLFVEARIPPGAILDAGAQVGEFSCYLGSAFPARQVVAVELNVLNVERMRSAYSASVPNMRVVLRDD